jgi:hypothetical protein
LIKVDFTLIWCIIVFQYQGGEHACFDREVDALVAGVTKAELQRMPPAHRQRLAQVLRYIADLADPPRVPSPKAGVPAELRDGQRVE